MGLKNVAHVHGGYTAWKEAGGKTMIREKKA
jgi:rhodanese-related sulfurtransferase